MLDTQKRIYRDTEKGLVSCLTLADLIDFLLLLTKRSDILSCPNLKEGGDVCRGDLAGEGLCFVKALRVLLIDIFLRRILTMDVSPTPAG